MSWWRSLIQWFRGVQSTKAPKALLDIVSTEDITFVKLDPEPIKITHFPSERLH